MTKGKGLVHVCTGSSILIGRIKAELELNGIFSIVKDGFQQGIQAGFVGGIPSAIDLFVDESDVEKANEIIEAIIQ